MLIKWKAVTAAGKKNCYARKKMKSSPLNVYEKQERRRINNLF